MNLRAPFTCIFLLYSFLSFCQDEKKEWAKKLKEMDPLALKALFEERDQLKVQVDTKTLETANLSKQIEELKASTVKMPVSEPDEKDVTANGAARQPANAQGVTFKVQIGAFKNKDLTKYFENNKNFSGDVDPDGTKKYTLGYFNEYWEADTFKKYLREMGVKDAWIVPYKDGKRLNIKDVLEGAID